MNVYVLDANAIIAFYLNREGADRIEKLFREVEARSAQLLISSVNWGEVFYVLRRTESLEEVAGHLAELRRAVEVISADAARAEAAAELKSTYKLGFADAFAAELAITTGATLVTFDPAFKKLGRNLKLRSLRSAARPS